MINPAASAASGKHSKREGTRPQPPAIATEGAVTPSVEESPSSVAFPMWLKVSGISAEACLVADILYAGTISAKDRRPTLDRKLLAYALNVNRADKHLPAVLTELVEIGFLTIYESGGVDKNGRRRPQRDPATGAVVPDRYGIRFDPPPNYVGPRHLGELVAAFERDRVASVAAHKALKKASRVVPINRTVLGRLSDGAVPPGGGTGCEQQGTGVPLAGGTGEFSQVNAVPHQQGTGVPLAGGTGEFSQVNGCTPSGGYLDRSIDPSPSGMDREIDRSTATAGPAKPAAEPQASEVALDLVAGLPWPRGAVPTEKESHRLGALVDAAVHQHGRDYTQLFEHLAARMTAAKRNPLRFLCGALDPENLPMRRRPTNPRFTVERQAPDSPDSPESPKGAQAPKSSPADTSGGLPEWCGTCGAGSGDAARWNARLRVKLNPDTSDVEPCSCHPISVSHTADLA